MEEIGKSVRVLLMYMLSLISKKKERVFEVNRVIGIVVSRKNVRPLMAIGMEFVSGSTWVPFRNGWYWVKEVEKNKERESLKANLEAIFWSI